MPNTNLANHCVRNVASSKSKVTQRDMDLIRLPAPMLGGAHPAASELGSGGGADSAATPQRSGGVLSPPRHTQHYCVQKGHCATRREKTSG